MNFDELHTPATDSDSGHSIDPERPEHRYQHPSQEVGTFPSIPIDPEWVSPFTLPPLPALRKNRGQSRLLRSPEERLHQRSTSSAYYAAAWGSPYATPSPNRSPPHRPRRRRSQDFETSSPLSSRTREFTTEASDLHKGAGSNLKPSSTRSIRRRANSWDKSTSLSERFNWLSESDLSGSEADIRSDRTPTREDYLTSLKSSSGEIKAARPYSHQIQESIATITPETFNALAEESNHSFGSPRIGRSIMDPTPGESAEVVSSGDVVDKPLPSLPPLVIDEKSAEPGTSTASPESPSRPRMQSIQSFQRPKRKVMWKGKTCIIALPLTDRENAGLPPLLTAIEIKQRMQTWAEKGYDLDQLMIGGPQDTSSRFGQSRSLFPDPNEMFAERKNGKLHVHIPDQSEWDAWVEYLKEAKLQALGVTPSNSEPPLSVQSPFSSTLSRVSSAYPSIAASPPITSHLVNGNQIRIASNNFSPVLGHPNGFGSHTGSHMASPSISGYPGPMHGYKQSIAQQRMTSPYDYPISHPGSFGASMRNTPGPYGVRQFSPPTAANLQSLSQVLSPMIPTIPSNDNGRGMAQHSTMEQIHQQQMRQQQLHQHMLHHQKQFSYFPPPQSKSADQLPRTPILESPSRHTPEIMHPTPRSHRHNLSAALQKGVDDAEAARTDRKLPVTEEDTAQPKPEATVDLKAEAATKDDQEPELPVLQRPQVLPDGDDKSEIETNPSIAASPMLMDDKNPFAAPFANLQQIKNALQPQSQHKSKPSTSRLNVDAPAFDPSARFSGSTFSFGGQSLQTTTSPGNNVLVGGSRPPFASKNQSISNLNVEAPAFTPSFMLSSTPTKTTGSDRDTPAKQSIATPSKASFTFSSPIFNVDAPEFKPGQSFSFTPKVSSLSQDQSPSLTSAGSIFGNVVIDANSKVSRRGKIIPIVRPQSAEDKEDELLDDEEGRVGAPTDRQKRARRVGGEDDEELLFASSAPFDHADGLSSRKEEESSHDVENQDLSTPDKTETHAAQKPEHAQPNQVEQLDNNDNNAKTEEDIPKVERGPEAPAKDAPGREEFSTTIESSQDETSQQTSLPVITAPVKSTTVETSSANETHAPDANVVPWEQEIKPEVEVNLDNSEKPLEVSEHEDQELMDSQPAIAGDASQINHKSHFSFSALAKPFEFRPGAETSPKISSTSVAKPTMEQRAAKGLMASRFAQASPERTLHKSTDESNSPPHELYEYIRPEDMSPTQPRSSHEPDVISSPALQFPTMDYETTPQLTRSIEESMRAANQLKTTSQSSSRNSRVEETMPSYEEIDAVMKQFENNPDLGVERDDTPVKPTPLIDMRLAPVFRSDAPSPSPRRMDHSPMREADWGLGIHRLNEGNDEVSEWDNEFSPRQEDKLQRQARYLDNHVNNLVGGILESRLSPLEHSLQTIQQSLVQLLDKKSNDNRRRSLSTEIKEGSDADDEDDLNNVEGYASYRSRSPNRSQRKADKIRTAVMDAMATYRPQIQEQPVLDMSEMNAALQDMRQLSQQAQESQSRKQPDLRALMEDVISTHPHFKAARRFDEYEAMQETYKLKLDVLNSSLKEAEKRTEHETALRRQVDDDMKQLNNKLLHVQEQATTYREASEEARLRVAELTKANESYQSLKSDYADILERNNALEDTLAEYRVSTEQFRNDIKIERARNEDLIKRMHNLRQDFNDKAESRQVLRDQLERLQDRMDQAMQDARADEDEWRAKEQDLVIQNKTLQAMLDHENRHREKIELELDNLDKEHKETMKFKTQHEHAQHEISRLQEHATKLTDEVKSHQDKSFKLEREIAHAKESTTNEVLLATSRLQSELDAARATIESLQTDTDAQISRLQKRLDDAELDLEDQKAKHDVSMTETIEAHNHALHEANQNRDTALEEQHASHERKLNDLRERHTRALHNSSDDRHRLENQLNEKLAINEERSKHLETQIRDLQEQLEITKSAARAAVEAATAKAANIPTPAPSVVASPPQRLSGASLQLMKGTDLPGKISPQAMRESIMVLQEQLQHREQTIEQLESEIAEFDKEAPFKIKERDNEIILLRELLSVRVDDLNEIIAILSQPKFDREATRNAAIRLKANLQMEQQLKERAASTGNLASALPSISTISNFAQSPRGLPMAAAAAWGNWRKARDFGINAVSDIATNISQTPSKSNMGSPSNFLTGIITPPSTSQRSSPPSDSNPSSPTIRPLAAAAAARKNNGPVLEARPLRIHSSQARTLSSRQAEKRRESSESSSSEASKRPPLAQPESPTTPLAGKSTRNFDLEEDIDEDASPLDPSQHQHRELDDEIKQAVTA